MNSNIEELLLILAIGLFIGASSYVTLSDQAAVLFVFLYIMGIPIVHEVYEYGRAI